jgi:hypothetical protein
MPMSRWQISRHFIRYASKFAFLADIGDDAKELYLATWAL